MDSDSETPPNYPLPRRRSTTDIHFNRRKTAQDKVETISTLWGVISSTVTFLLALMALFSFQSKNLDFKELQTSW